MTVKLASIKGVAPGASDGISDNEFSYKGEKSKAQAVEFVGIAVNLDVGHAGKRLVKQCAFLFITLFLIDGAN